MKAPQAFYLIAYELQLEAVIAIVSSFRKSFPFAQILVFGHEQERLGVENVRQFAPLSTPSSASHLSFLRKRGYTSVAEIKGNVDQRPPESMELYWTESPCSAPIHILMPFYCKNTGKKRFSNFLALLKIYQKKGLKVLVSLQGKKGFKDIKATGCDVLVTEFPDTNFHKSALINRGLELLLKSDKWAWVFQCDADLLCDIDTLADTVANNNNADVVKPWIKWIRFGREETDTLINLEKWEGRVAYKRAIPPVSVNCGLVAGGIVLSRRVAESFRWNEEYVNWGWEDSEAASRLSAAYPVVISPSFGLHLWHENDRVVEEANGELFFGGEIPENNKAGVMLEAKTKFLVVAMGRSGGNLFCRALNRHPQVHCDYAEDFVNTPISPPLRPTNIAFRNWTLLGPMASKKSIVGMRMQYIVPGKGYEFTAEEYVRWAHSQGFYLIHLVREDTLAKVISFCLAEANNSWVHRPYNDVKIYLPPDKVRTMLVWQNKERSKWDAFLQSLQSERFTYEGLCSNWEAEMNRAYAFLGVSSYSVKMPIKKQARKHYSEYVENWQEVKESVSDLWTPDEETNCSD